MNIEGDLKRGWSAWMGRAATLKNLVENDASIDENDLAERWEEYQDECGDADYDEFLYSYCENHRKDFVPMFDEFAPTGYQWCWWHHDGLSCYRLDAENETDALAGAAQWDTSGFAGGFGSATQGKVRLVATLENYWHLLECDDTMPE